jgi:hypothetical protein
VRDAVHGVVGQHVQHRLAVDPCRFQQFRGQVGKPRVARGSGEIAPLDLEQRLTGQGKAVGMQATGGQAQDRVAGLNALGIEEALALDHGDGKTREVVLATGIEARKFRGFAAQQRAPGLQATLGNAGDDRGGDLDVQATAGEIVQEEDGFGTGAQDVVDAHGHQIDADGGVAAGQERELELGADAIGAGHEHGIPPAAVQREQATESAESAEDPGAPGAASQGGDAVHESVTALDVDASAGVGQARGGGRSAHAGLATGKRRGVGEGGAIRRAGQRAHKS